MVFFAVEFGEFGFEVFADVFHYFFASGEHVVVEDSSTVFRDEDQMGVKVMYYVSAVAYIGVVFPAWCHSPMVFSVVSS